MSPGILDYWKFRCREDKEKLASCNHSLLRYRITLVGCMNTVYFNLYWMQILTMVWTCLFTSTTTLSHGDVHCEWKVVCLDGSFTRYHKPSPIHHIQSITSKLTSVFYHSEELAAPFSFPFSKKIPEIKILSFYFSKLTPFFLPFSHNPVNYTKSLIFGK